MREDKYRKGIDSCVILATTRGTQSTYTEYQHREKESTSGFLNLIFVKVVAFYVALRLDFEQTVPLRRLL